MLEVVLLEIFFNALVAELVDDPGLKSRGSFGKCGFKSHQERKLMKHYWTGNLTGFIDFPPQAGDKL